MSKSYLIKIVFFIFIIVGHAYAFETPPTVDVSLPSETYSYFIDFDQTDPSEDGTSDHPWNNLEDADGSVSVPCYIYIKGTDANGAVWTQNGSSGNEIVFVPWGANDAIFTGRVFLGSYGSGAPDYSNSGDYIIFDGGSNKLISFTAPSGGATSAYPLNIYGDHVTIRRCNGYGAGAAVSAGNVIIPTFGNDVKILNCEIWDSYGAGVYIRDGINVDVKNNVIHACRGSAIQLNPHESGDESDEVTISGNALYDAGKVFETPGQYGGLTLLSGNDSTYDVYVYNNLIWDCEFGAKTYGYSNLNLRFFNNTIYANENNGIEATDTAGTGAQTFRNNISYGNGGTDLNISGSWTASNNVSADPSFLSTTAGSDDYLKLSSSSTNCIGQGYDTNPPVAVDYAGTSRDASTPDIGAHEYDGAYSTPTVQGCTIQGGRSIP